LYTHKSTYNLVFLHRVTSQRYGKFITIIVIIILVFIMRLLL